MYVLLNILVLNSVLYLTLFYFSLYIYIYSKVKVEIVISPSTRKSNKYHATIHGTNKISFGDSDYSDFTKHKDP